MSSLTYLNVGLKRSDNGQLLSYVFVEQVLLHLGLGVVDFKLFQSDSEPTAVVTIRDIDFPLVETAAEFLRQDAIAVYSPHRLGVLIGPKAAEWGDFNPEFFIMPDGRRLSKHLEAGT